MLVLVSFAKLFYSLVNKTENGPKKVFHTNTLEFLTMLKKLDMPWSISNKIVLKFHEFSSI